jgi:hypothetical protein
VLPVREGKGFPSQKTILTEENRKGDEEVPMTQLQQQLKTLAHWRGSAKTADAVREEIARRWGQEEAKQYDPFTNCFTLQTWNKLGYRVKKGEKAIRSITYVEAKDQTAANAEDGMKNLRFGHTPKPSTSSTGHRLKSGSVSALCSVVQRYWAGAGTIKKHQRERPSMSIPDD